MYFYQNTCIYIKQYMNVFPTVYLAVYLYAFPTVFLAVFFVHILALLKNSTEAGNLLRGVFFVHIHTATVPSLLLRVRRRRRAVPPPSPRGRYGKFVALQRKRRQIATFKDILSYP
jgi:hypothetical protein